MTTMTILPQARSTYYPTSPNPPPLPPSVHSPNSLRRERGASSKNGQYRKYFGQNLQQTKSGRPFSADVGRLLSVQEGSENGDEARAKVRGHNITIIIITIIITTIITTTIIIIIVTTIVTTIVTIIIISITS